MPKSIKAIKDITPDKANANKGTQRGRGMVESSLRRYGAGRSILVDKDGNVIAGNKTIEAAEEIGLSVKVVQTDGTELVVVQRTDLDLYEDPAARQLAYADNRAAEVGIEWDAEQVAADLAAGVEVDLFFNADEIEAILEDLGDADDAADDPDDDAAPEMTISPELHERHDYLVLYFDNELDWRAALTAFEVETVRCAPVGKKTADHRGLGRVIAGRKALRLMGVEAGGD